MREAPPIGVVCKRRFCFEGGDVIAEAGDAVPILAIGPEHEFEILHRPRAKVRLCPRRSELNELAVPLGEAFSKEAAVDCALLENSPGPQFHFPDRGLPLTARAFIENATGVDQALSQCLRI